MAVLVCWGKPANAAFCTTSTQVASPSNGASFAWSSSGVGFTIQARWSLGNCSAGGPREITYYVDGGIACDKLNGSPTQMSCSVSGLGVGAHTIEVTDWNSYSTITVYVNAPPTTINLSVNSTSFNMPASIVMTANASANGYGYINYVQFYGDGNLLYTSYGAPYTYTWSNAAQGNHSVSAKAYNGSSGATATASLNVSVYGTPGFIAYDNQCHLKL